MSHRIPATTAQHKSAARRLLAMRRELRQVLDELGVGASSPGGMPAVTAKETDALNALDRAILRCATTLNARMSEDGQEPPVLRPHHRHVRSATAPHLAMNEDELAHELTLA